MGTFTQGICTRSGRAALARILVLPDAILVSALPAQGRNRSRSRGGEGGRCERVRTKAKARTCLKIVGFNPMRDRSFRVSRPKEFRLRPLAGRVGDWRAGLGRSSCSLLARSFVCECHTISTMPRFQPPPRRTQHADFLALRSPVCFASRHMGPILPGRLSALVVQPDSP